MYYSDYFQKGFLLLYESLKIEEPLQVANITDIGSKLWVPKLINYNIVYLSDFVNKQGEVIGLPLSVQYFLSR